MIATRGILIGTGLALLLAAGQPGCRAGEPASRPADAAASQPAGTMVLTCPAFKQGEPIPKKYTGEGENVSPPLAWTGAPAGTKQFALIMDDPDAEGKEPWAHWVVHSITPNVQSLPAGIPKDGEFCDIPLDLSNEPPTMVMKPEDMNRFRADLKRLSAWMGHNSWGKVAYNGPMPPPGRGVHHYHFKLYALDAMYNLDACIGGSAEATGRDILLNDMSGHILATAELVGTYERK